MAAGNNVEMIHVTLQIADTIERTPELVKWQFDIETALGQIALGAWEQFQEFGYSSIPAPDVARDGLH